jgi:hypothetical protein
VTDPRPPMARQNLRSGELDKVSKDYIVTTIT